MYPAVTILLGLIICVGVAVIIEISEWLDRRERRAEALRRVRLDAVFAHLPWLIEREG